MINVSHLENKLQKVAFYLGILCLASVLLITLNTLRPFILGKMLPFQTFSLLLTVVWVILMILDFKKYRPRFNWLTIAVTIFYVVILLSCIFSTLPYRSFWGNAERMEGFISLFHFYLFFLALSSIFYSDKETIRKLVFASICVNFTAALWPILEFLKIIPLPVGESLARPGGLFGNPAFFAGFLMVHLFLTVWYYLMYGKKESSIIKIFLIGSGIISFIVFLWAQTRGSMIGLLGGLFVALVASIFLISNKKYKKWSAIASAVIIVGAILFIIFQPQIQKSAISKDVPAIGRLASISLSDSSTRARILNWQRSVEWWKQRPILGYGQDMFYQVFDKNYTANDYALSRERFDRAHNKFFDVLVMNGIVGLLAYLFMLGVVAYFIVVKIKKSENTTAKFAWLAILGLFASYLGHNFFVFDTPANSIFFYFFLAFINISTIELWDKDNKKSAAKLARKEAKKQRKIAQNKNFNEPAVLIKKIGSVEIGLIILVLILAGFIIYQIDIKSYQAAKLVADATRINGSKLGTINSVYQKAIGLNTFLNTEIKKTWADYFYSYLINVSQGKINANKDDVVSAYEQVKDNLLLGYKHEPMVDFYIYLANISLRMSDLNFLSNEERAYYLNEAHKYFDFIAKNWPTRTDLYINAILYDDTETAQKRLDQILTITPKYGLASWMKSILLIKQNADPQEIYNNVSNAFENGYQFSLSDNSDYIWVAIEGLDKLQKDGKIISLIDNGIAEEENILAHQKLNAFERDIHLNKVKSLIDFAILIETINTPEDQAHLLKVIDYLQKADSYQNNRPEILIKLAAAYAHLHDKEKAIDYAKKVMVVNNSYATDAEIFINLVEQEKWDQIE